MKYETRKYRLCGLTELLGSQPANPDVRTAYLISKCPDPVKAAEEEELITPEDDAGLSVFLRDPKTNGLMIMEYVIKGFLKEAFKNIEEIKVAAYKSKIDGLVFVAPRRIPILREGVILEEEDGIDERILRADTAKGPRTALVGSEMVDTPWELEVEITVLANSGTAKSEPITFDTIETALDYGQLRGLGQFRNGGYGQFTWEDIA